MSKLPLYSAHYYSPKTSSVDMQKISTTKIAPLADYASVCSAEIIDQLKVSAKQLKNYKIVEINSTATGGGVAELLQSQIPLCHELGLDIDWYVIPPNERFFDTTKALHNCLQGQCNIDQVPELDYYQTYLDQISHKLPPADLYILHDPQTLGLVPALKGKPLIWRCHIDMTTADRPTLLWLERYYRNFAKIILSLKDYAHGVPTEKQAIITPSIDPFSEKNRPLTPKQIDQLLAKYGLDSKSLFMTQVSRFDKFKDPLGVVDLYERLLERQPLLQCILVGNYATDDPEGGKYYELLKSRIAKLKAGSVKIITDATPLQVNALQRSATIVVQNSTREGFGLTVTEALWKKRLVFSRPVGGINLQIIDGVTGFFLQSNTTDNLALLDQAIRQSASFSAIARSAHQHVMKRFITPIMLNDYLALYANVLTNRLKN